MTAYKYDHPQGKGFGEHHVEEDHPALEDRSANWQGVEGADGLNWKPRAGELSMKELDMPPGTEVDLLEDDTERGLKRVAWVDGQGTLRVTSVDPTLFDEYFSEVPEAEA